MKTKLKGILLSSAIVAFAVSLTSAKAENPYPTGQTVGEVSAPGVIAPQPPAMQTSNYETAESAYAPAPLPETVTAPQPTKAQIMAAPPAFVTAPTQVATASPASVKGPYVRVYEFGAKWCPSCRKLKPFVHDTMEKYTGFAEFNYVDTDKNPDLVRQLNIMQIPQVIIVDKRGRMLNRLTGYEQGVQLDLILTNYKQQIQSKQQQPQ